MVFIFPKLKVFSFKLYVYNLLVFALFVLYKLKDKILESSPTFYPLISSISLEELEKADEKIRYTVWKYWNRAKFRATPFGSFAAFSILPLKEACEGPILSEIMQVHSFIDWPEKDKVLKKVDSNT